MADLVDKFYEGDLTPAEEESLDLLLESSPEAADRFAKRAAEAYARYGLPDMGPESNPGQGFGWRLRLEMLALVLTLTAGYGWWHHRQSVSSNVSAESQAPAVESRSTKPALAKPSGGREAGENPSEKLLPQSQKAGLSKAGENQALEGNPVPAVGPASKAPGAGGKASRLRIMVEIGQEGPVTVEILDAQGARVKSLFNGALPSGSYSFSWDGKLEDGRKALPGQYRIETHSGSTVQTQEFSIEKK